MTTMQASRNLSKARKHPTRPAMQSRSDPAPIPSLQQTIGNQAIAREFRAGRLQAKLAVSRPGDLYEQEADRIAEQILRMPAPTVQKKCAPCAAGGPPCPKCQDEERPKIQRASTAGTETSAPDALVDHLGPGQSLDAGTRTFMESRFGADFSGVRLHTDPVASASAKSIQARAYTLGRDIVFAPDEYRPGTTEGQRLLAHELTHVIQQQGGARAIQRKLTVVDPKSNIPNPGGKGAVQTNAKTIEDYLKTLCPEGAASVKVDPGSGAVSIDKTFCSPVALPKGIAGPPSPAPAETSKFKTGCTCICDFTASAHDWKIEVNDADWPHTDFDDDPGSETPGKGTGGKVTAPSPNSPKLWGAATAGGATLDIDPWLVLGHELCGHGWLGDRGEHKPDVTPPRGEGGHQKTVERENLLRAEHGIDLRGTFKDPYCGESYWRDKAAPGKVNWSSFLSVCEAWRKAYNKKMGTKYKISDKIP